MRMLFICKVFRLASSVMFIICLRVNYVQSFVYIYILFSKQYKVGIDHTEKSFIIVQLICNMTTAEELWGVSSEYACMYDAY